MSRKSRSRPEVLTKKAETFSDTLMYLFLF